MRKVTVTFEQQKEINEIKEMTSPLKRYLTTRNRWTDKPDSLVHEMTDKQIAAAWLGVAEVEPEYVSFEEAMRALKEGKSVVFRGPNSQQDYKEKVTRHEAECVRLSSTDLRGHGLFDLIDGKWTIEDKP